MGKNHRHKKQLKSEKSKTKLKAVKTKFLPKGQNITDLSFKIKPITIGEQLKSKENQVVSSRKLNLKEILIRLNHYNTTVKYENCQQLRELISMEKEEFLKQNLSKILAGICPLMQDKEQKVRREAIKVIKEILSLSSSADISSFFNILSSFLRCVMTHINQNIQEDSLLMLDLLLEHVPDLVVKNSNKILKNFFTLISKFKNETKNIRTLAENLNSKYTGVKWRIQVLSRLEKILMAMYEHIANNSKSNQSNVPIIDCSNTCYAPIYVNKYIDYMKLSTDFESESTENVRNYINTLLPLLNETWLEVAPSIVTNTTTGELNFTPLKQESANTLYCVIKIFYLLYQLSDSLDRKNNNAGCLKIKMTAAANMFHVILQSFPYIRISEENKKKMSKVSNSNEDLKCVEENLLICYLFCVQYNQVKDKQRFCYAEKILNYLNFCLLNRKYIEFNQIKLFLSIIRQILGKNLLTWKQAGLPMEKFIENTVHYYLQNNQIPNDEGTELLFLLYDVLDPNSEKHENLAEKCCGFLLRDRISPTVLDAVLLLVKKGVRPVQECVRRNMEKILGHVKNVEIIGVDINHMKVVRVLCLFYYIPLSDDDVNILEGFGDENVDYKSLIQNICDLKNKNGF